MPVVSKQKGEDSGEIQAGPPLNGHTLSETSEEFRKHHEDCSERRKNGLSHELRVEAQRTEWLKRKYIDNLRQQQALSGRLEAPRIDMNGLTMPESGTVSTNEALSVKQSPGTPDSLSALLTSKQESSNNNNSAGVDTSSHFHRSDTPHTHPIRNGTSVVCHAITNGHSDAFSLASVLIKTEPDSESMEALPSCLKSPPTQARPNGSRKTPPISISLPTSTGSSAGNNSTCGTPEPKRRRSSYNRSNDSIRPSPSLRGRSFSGPDDTEDDLKLSVKDCIDGVISTPPIKPLEEEDCAITPSPPTSVSLPKSDSSSSTPSASASKQEPTGGGAAGSSKEPSSSSYIKEALDEFSKVMDQVTKEEKAKERRASHSSVPLLQKEAYRTSHLPEITSRMQQPPVISPPPYYATARQHPPPVVSHVTSGNYFVRTTQHSYTTPPGHPSIPDPSYRTALQFSHVPLPQIHPEMDPSFPHHPRMLQRPKQLQHELLSISSQFQGQPPLASPTIHTPISTHMPSFPDLHQGTSSVAAHTPTRNLPQTPTTPLEHFSMFSHQHPSSQISPTHPTPFLTSTASIPSAYLFGQKGHSDMQVPTVVRSPTVTAAGSSWSAQVQQGSLREALLTQVNTRLEALTGQRRPGQDGLGIASYPAVRVTHSTTVHPPAMPSAFTQHQSQYPSSYTGVTSSMPHTILYQGQPTAYPPPM